MKIDTNRVGRGGGWSHSAGHCRVSYRVSGAPALRFYALGFRLVLS